MIHKINDWFFFLVERYMDAHYGRRKRELLKNHPNTIVEIGIAYGANFKYLRPGTKVIAIEPKESFNEVMKRRADFYGIDLEIHNYNAEVMNIKSNSVDLVLGSLVLCSVKSPVKVISEIRRILKPEGKYVFIEHVKADRHSWICTLQNAIKNPWKWFFDGCHLTRNTGKIIQNSMYSEVKMEEFNSKTIFLPIIPHVCGTAVK